MGELLLHFYISTLSEKQLNFLATSVFRKQKVRKYNKTEHNFQKTWKSWTVRYLKSYQKAEFIALWLMEKEMELCFIFKT